MQERVILLDGGMGSQIFTFSPTPDDYGGPQLDGCVENLNYTRPQWIQSIHERYFKAGSDAVETNTFGCNEIVLHEFGLKEKAFEFNVHAAKLAREVALSFDEPKYVIGSVGPGTRILTLGHITYAEMYQSYLVQMKGLLEGNVDVLLIETAQDIAQVKLAIRAARHAMREHKREVPLWAQVTIETTGSMLVGTDIQTALAALEGFPLQVVGLNCATGPQEMRPSLAYLSEHSPFGVSCLPNAGLPLNQGGKTVYPLQPEDFSKQLKGISSDFNIGVLGGCCGTTPEHIQELSKWAKDRTPPKPKSREVPYVSSLYSAIPLNLEPRPLFVGERTNANGSKKFRECLASNDFESLVEIAKEQQKEGAHILDVCVAYVSRNETQDMDQFVKLLATQIQIPLMIDSTEAPVIEVALQRAPGKCVVNSINFEDGEAKARVVLGLCKEYGAAVVALTIDESGMAKSCEHKVAIAKRIYTLAVQEFGMHPGEILFDPLTFTLGSGDEEFRKSAIETLHAIKQIKVECPGSLTILGLSNVSFGLNPSARQMLNSVMLAQAVEHGLDSAILNASKIIPMFRIPEEDRKIFEDLIFDRRTPEYDPLKKILERFSGNQSFREDTSAKSAQSTLEEQLVNAIVCGDKKNIGALCLKAAEKYPPLAVINDHLLSGMKVVGEKFGTGQMQLPFVLESAEAMKTAVKALEPLLEKSGSYAKGKMLLATVKGDVHDIGKNLVEIILSNNGYDVINLGIKQPIESILEKYQQTPVDAIGLSGLLVKSTVIMKENLEYMKSRGFQVPVILGGAALTRHFVESECQEAYVGPVFYASDAFEGLRLMEAICKHKETHPEEPLPVDRIRAMVCSDSASKTLSSTEPSGVPEDTSAPTKIKVIKRGESKVSLTPKGHSSWVNPFKPSHSPPFWGTQVLQLDCEKVLQYVDEFALIRSRWGFKQGNLTSDEFQEVLHTKAYPALSHWKNRLIEEKIIVPKAIYGYFKVMGNGDHLDIFKSNSQPDNPPFGENENLDLACRLTFPRQLSGRKLCISDFFVPPEGSRYSVMGVQLVTLGYAASEFSHSFYQDQKFAEYYLIHGLLTEITEACAEYIHHKVRAQLGVAHLDAPTMSQLFSQGYQGSRYSFGYPACPDMAMNGPLLELLDSRRIGVDLSESDQMHPELSTSAIITVHPQARYFSV